MYLCKVMKKILITLIASFSFAFAATAQEAAGTPKFTVDGEARVDYLSDFGFFGKNINLIVHGEILPGLTYHVKQELNRPLELRHAFDATDWAYLQYNPTEHWTFSAGKMVFAMGAYDYNTSPIDNYFCSVFGADLACYKFGVSAKYSFPSRQDHITFQISDSPFTTIGHNLYGYSLMFEHTRDWFSALNSVNVIEYAKNSYLLLGAIGNRFSFGKITLDLDAIWRYASNYNYPIEDFTLSSKYTFNLNGHFDFFGRVCFDRNTSESSANVVVPVGSRIWKTGLGVEYFPLKDSRDLRLHAVIYHVGEDLYGEKFNSTTLNVGVTWDVHFVRR